MDNSLERYVKAQENVYESALMEIKNGLKETHWMWFIFPQIVGLGYSSTSEYYGIKSKEEAVYYLEHELLGARLLEITSVLLTLNIDNPVSIFGGIDALKLKSSMTLFYEVSGMEVFASVLDKYYDGEKDEKTIAILKSLESNKSKKISLLDRLKSLC